MSTAFDAVYENGLVRILEPVKLREAQKLIVLIPEDEGDPMAGQRFLAEEDIDEFVTVQGSALWSAASPRRFVFRLGKDICLRRGASDLARNQKQSGEDSPHSKRVNGYTNSFRT